MKKIYSLLVASLFSVMFLSAAPTSGLLFSGTTSSIINLGQQAAFSPSQFTIEVWVNYQVLNGGGYIISTEGASPTNHGFSLRLNGNKLNFSIGDGANWPGINSSADITPKTWFHAAVTCTETQMTLYINGVQDATATLAAPMVASPENIILGDSPAWTGRCFNGIMSDLRFWNVARTQADIAADMTSTLVGTETGLVAGWKMNEANGASVADVKAAYPITLSSNVSWYPVTAVSVSGSAISTFGGTSQLAATLNGNLTLAQAVTWTVNDPSIATISASGLLAARKNGTVTVTATSKDGATISGSTQIVVSNQPTPSKKVFIDFGPNDVTNGNITTSPDANGNYWNNEIVETTPSTAIALVDYANAASGFSLVVTTGMSKNGILNGGLLAPNASYLGEFAIPTATQDYFFGTTGGLKISGLNVSKGYRFCVFGSRDNTETRISQFVFTGTNAMTGTLQTSGTNLGGTGVNNNNSTILNSDIIFPNANGEITIDISKTAGSFFHLNTMKLEEYSTINVTNINVTGAAISTNSGTSQMTATVLPSYATVKDVVWTVDNPTIATVNSTGLLTANNNGTVTVTATSKDGSGVIGSAQIVVSNQPIPVKQVYIDFSPVGGTSGFTTTNPDSNGNNWNTVTNATAAAGSVALMDKTGAASGFSMITLVDFAVNPNNGVMGLATPSASLLGDFAIPSATKDFFFLDANTTTRSLKITGLSANKGYRFYAYGCRVATDTRISKYTFTGATSVSGTQQTTGTNLGGTGINGNNSTIFATPIMAADANGEVKFELGFVTGMAYINIMKIEETNINVAGINVAGAAITDNGGTSQMTATVLPANATVQTVTWSVDNTAIATIDANGLLTAKENGTVIVTATTTEAGSTVSNSAQVVISGQTATGLSNVSAALKVYPVVFNDKVTVKGATAIVELFNATGVKVTSQVATSETTINTSNLPKGAYVLVVDKKQSYKLIK